MVQRRITLHREELDHLEQLARAATQDEWQFGHSNTTTLEEATAWISEIISHCDSPDLWGVFCGDPDDHPSLPATTGNGPTSEANARYLQAVQPRNVLKLLIFLRQMMGDQGVIDAPLPMEL